MHRNRRIAGIVLLLLAFASTVRAQLEDFEERREAAYAGLLTEFEALLGRVGVRLTRDELETQLALVDRDRSQCIHLAAFVRWYCSFRSELAGTEKATIAHDVPTQVVVSFGDGDTRNVYDLSVDVHALAPILQTR